MSASFLPAVDAFAKWRDDLRSGKGPTLYPVGEGALGRLQIGPGLVTLLGGPPGIGKTALVCQLVFEALRLNPSLRVLLANVEVPAPVILDRQLARLASLDLSLIRHRQLADEHGEALTAGLEQLEALCERLTFLQSPFDLANVAATADTVEAGLIVLDYIQRIPPPGDHKDKRGSVSATMDYLRQFADAEIAVVAVAAVGRTRDSQGRSSYDADGLGLASFRESSELEFGADDAFLLGSRNKSDPSLLILRHLKSRHGAPVDIPLHFIGEHQRFEPLDEPTDEPAPSTASRRGKATSPEMAAQLARLWQGAGTTDGDGRHE